MQHYKLSAQLDPKHLGDVKAILAIDDETIATASRDYSVAVWKRGQDDTFSLASLLDGHHAYVNSLAYIPPTIDDKDAYVASGGNSSLILLHSLTGLGSESRHCLIGHNLNVCALSYSPLSQKLISGSWDHTARVWSEGPKGWETNYLLEGHDEGVWGVAIIDRGVREGCYLTADCLINLWGSGGQLVSRFKGSPEPVRGLTILPDEEWFASACNDGVIRIWDLSGSVVRVLRGHSDYVYHVEAGSNGLLLSCGEDHTARVWNKQGESSSILHPCQTVWAATFLTNGDVVTGGSDGRVRIWTASQERLAPAREREEYDEEMHTVATSLTTAEAGQGQYQGEELTIDIDISDDAPPIPLVYRFDADPRATAEKFGKEHSLSERYIDQIEVFLKAYLGQAAGEA